MRQVIIIHGGDSFSTYRKYINYLRRLPMSVKSYQPAAGWKAKLPKELGRSWQVLQPRMPNAMNARYGEWKLWFEKMRPFWRQHVILVGHSLGGMFLARYLAENKFPKKIKALILIAAAFKANEGAADFKLPKSLVKVSAQCPQIYVFQSRDDKIVRPREAQQYIKLLPTAKPKWFKNQGHFSKGVPGLVKLLKNL